MDYDEIQFKIENIVNNPIRHFKPEELKGIIERYHKNHPKSKEIFERMRRIIPGGVEHNLAFNHPFPIASKKVYGAYMETVDDVVMTDYLMCGGPIILGHQYKPLIDKVIETIQEIGPCHGITHEYEYLAAEQLQRHFPSCEIIRWLQSGTEADMAVIRIARVFTGKDKIIKFGGSYHGWSDQLNYDIHIPFSGAMESDGIPRGCYKDTISLPPNDLEAVEENLKKWSAKRSGVAAVIVEPLGAESGALPIPPGFNKALRELCDQYDVLLIFDEVVTGFRLDLGGAQKYFNVKPDLTVFGKIITQGYPSAGAVGGREDVMNVIEGGIDVGGKKASVSGTIRGNPLTVAATYWGIKFIEEQDIFTSLAFLAYFLSNSLMISNPTISIIASLGSIVVTT